MVLLYDPILDMRFLDYGIQIPIRDRRAQAVLDFLGIESQSLDSAANALDIPQGACSISRKDLERVHNGGFIDSLFGDGLEAELIRTYELIDEQGQLKRYDPKGAVRTLSELFTTIRTQAWGTYLACRMALDPPGGAGDSVLSSHPGFCYYLGGGMHHARFDSGSGFCLLNDILIAARRLQSEGFISSVWIIDLDAHKGDGTAELAAGDGSLLTLSIHMAAGWPLDPESLAAAVPGRAPLVPSDVDIPISLEEQDAYIPHLTAGLAELEALSAGKRPDLAIVVDGADPYEKDELPSSGNLQLPLETCVERDLLVYRFLQDRRIPSAWLLAGGYGDHAWEPPAHFLKRVLTL